MKTLDTRGGDDFYSVGVGHVRRELPDIRKTTVKDSSYINWFVEGPGLGTSCMDRSRQRYGVSGKW